HKAQGSDRPCHRRAPTLWKTADGFPRIISGYFAAGVYTRRAKDYKRNPWGAGGEGGKDRGPRGGWRPRPRVQLTQAVQSARSAEMTMVLRWLRRALGGESWPDDIPRLYPELSFPDLCSFLSDREYRRLLQVTPIKVLPLSSGASSDKDWLLGVGLSRMMIRDLMLVPQLSVR